MGYINEKINQLEQELINLKSRINTMESTTPENTAPNPYTIVGGNKDISDEFPVDLRTALGGTYGNFMPWNNAELNFPPYGQKPSIEPTIGYHRHSHSRYAGGALDINTLEFIEYDINWNTDETYSKHSQQFWETDPPIKKDDNGIEQIGTIYGDSDEPNIVWDKNKECFRFYAVYAPDEEEE